MCDRIFDLILIKEFIELRRDTWARFRLIVPPLIQMLVFGYAATFEVYQRLDRRARSRPYAGKPRTDLAFHRQRPLPRSCGSRRPTPRSHDAIDRSDAVVAIVIQPGFAEASAQGPDRAGRR